MTKLLLIDNGNKYIVHHLQSRESKVYNMNSQFLRENWNAAVRKNLKSMVMPSAVELTTADMGVLSFISQSSSVEMWDTVSKKGNSDCIKVKMNLIQNLIYQFKLSALKICICVCSVYNMSSCSGC